MELWAQSRNDGTAERKQLTINAFVTSRAKRTPSTIDRRVMRVCRVRSDSVINIFAQSSFYWIQNVCIRLPSIEVCCKNSNVDKLWPSRTNGIFDALYELTSTYVTSSIWLPSVEEWLSAVFFRRHTSHSCTEHNCAKVWVQPRTSSPRLAVHQGASQLWCCAAH